MAVDPDEWTNDSGADDLDPARKHYKSEFNKPLSSQPSAKKALGAGDLAQQEGAFKNQSGLTAASNKELGLLNSLGGGLRSRFSSFKFNRKKTITGSILGLVVGGGALFGGSFLSGPLQVVHLGEMLKHSSAKSESDSANRTGHLFRYARTGDVAETRLGALGSRVYGKTIRQLKASGVEIETGRTGQPTRTRIDTEKLQESIPELEGKSTADKKIILADNLGINASSIEGSGNTFTIDHTNMSLGDSRLLTQSSVSLLNDGKIVTALKSRVLTKALDLPSLFHPIQKAKATLTKKYVNGKPVSEKQQAADEEAAEKKAVVDTASGDGAATAVKDANDQLHGANAATTRLLTFTGFACQIRNVANDIVVIDRARVVLPAIAASTRVIAAASQVKSGTDITALQVGAISSSFTDKNGKSIWQGKALQALSGGNTKGLKDIDHGQKQAFGSHKTVDEINEMVDGATGGHPSIACSNLSQTVQGVVTIGIAGIEEIGSAGTATGAVILEFAGKQAAQFVVAAAALHLIEDVVTKKNTVSALSKDAFSGPSGGSLYAYGSRAAANQTAISTGGVALDNEDSTLAANTAKKHDEAQFKSESTFAKVFDAKDYRSVSGRLIDKISPKPTDNIALMANGLLSAGHWLPQSFAKLMPHASADSGDSSYDWGFTQYGIPQDMLDDPQLSDPYANADAVAQMLDAQCKNGDGSVNTGCSIISRVKACFGSDINLTTDSQPVWDVIPTQNSSATDSIDPNSDNYVSNNCGDTSDPQWRRIIMFVFDTNTMKAAACYQGDDTSCGDIGISPNEEAPTTGTGGSFRIESFNVKGASHGGNWPARLKKSLAVIDQQKPDVIGFQEFQTPQRRGFLDKFGSTYAIYPTTAGDAGHRSEDSIVWNKSKFKFISGGIMPNLHYFSGSELDAPYVKLLDISTNQELYVLNTHDPADGTPGAANAIWRFKNANAHVAFINTLKKQHIPIFFTGDFNAGYCSSCSGPNNAYQDKDANGTYCIITKEPTLNDGYDLAVKRPAKCPNKQNLKGPNAGGVDHVFMSPGVTVEKWTRILPGPDGSDHPTILFDVTMPGQASSSSAQQSGWQWPVTKQTYKGISQCFKKPGHTGIDIPVSVGTPVYAAKDGTVVQIDTVGSGDGGKYIIIKHGDALFSNYQHNSRIYVTVGQAVKAGDTIALSGATGNVTGPHVHFSITTQAGLDSRNAVAYSVDPLGYLPNDRNENPCK